MKFQTCKCGYGMTTIKEDGSCVCTDCGTSLGELKEEEENMTGLTFFIEYGALTEDMVKAGMSEYTVCRLNIVFCHNDKPLGNIIGNKITLDGSGKYQFSSCADKAGGGFFNFTGFSEKAREAIIKKALEHERKNTLVKEWTVNFAYNPKGRAKGKALVVKDGKVKAETQVQGFTKPTPAFSG